MSVPSVEGFTNKLEIRFLSHYQFPPSCGTANQLGAKFCKKCGQRMAMTAPAAAGASKFSSPEFYTPKHLAEKILTSKAALGGDGNK